MLFESLGRDPDGATQRNLPPAEATRQTGDSGVGFSRLR
jgi:hypothetical protein